MNSQSMPFALLLVVALFGCAPPWATLAQSGPPSALAGAPAVSVMFNFNEANIGGVPVQQELASLSPDERADLEGAFGDMQSAFMEEFAGRVGVPVMPAQAAPQPGEVRAEVAFTYMQRGPRGPIGFSNTEVTAQIRWSVGGQITDVIEMTRVSKPALTRPSVAQRLRICASGLGALTAKFFEREQGRL